MTRKDSIALTRYSQIAEAKQNDVRTLQAGVARSMLNSFVAGIKRLPWPTPNARKSTRPGQA